jgi:uncharacterized membrane protein YbhN (UPF0104 family)
VTHILSHAKQLLQVASAAFLLLALGQPAHPAYLLLFLVSSLAVVLPITIGGIGARELAVVYIGAWFPIEEEIMVAMTLLFFLITAIASLMGAAIKSLPVELEDGSVSTKAGEDLVKDTGQAGPEPPAASATSMD